MNTLRHISLIVIALCLPFILLSVCSIQPTFDDYTTLQSPWWVRVADPGYFFSDCLRRPFDALLGAIVGWWPALFPTLNHVLIVLGHAACALLLFSTCRHLQLGFAATNIAVLFFFFSPATLGVTLACDGFNQTFAQFWGLMSLRCYLVSRQRQELALRPTSVSCYAHHSWLLFVVLAVLSKENGLAWAVVPPIVGYAFQLTAFRTALRDASRGLLLAVVYMLVYITLTLTGVLEYSEEYTEESMLSHLKDLVQVLAFTWVPLDYMSVCYAPLRNLPVAAVTALLSLPFLLAVGRRAWQTVTAADFCVLRRLLLLVACFFVLISPHLLTVVSIMHNYASLSMAALIVAVLLSSSSSCCRSVLPTFALFLAAALFTYVHHYIAARESGLLGKHLAQQAIAAAGEPPQRAFVINVDRPEEPRYSSFCVRPVDAFGWGLSVLHFSGYSWHTVISEVRYDNYSPSQVQTAADSALHAGCDVVWVVGHKADSLTVLTAR